MHYRSPTTLFGLATLILIILVIFIGPWFYPQSADAIDFNLASQPPSWTHPFGTNTLGQDQLARVMLQLVLLLVSMLILTIWIKVTTLPLLSVLCVLLMIQTQFLKYKLILQMQLLLLIWEPMQIISSHMLVMI